MGASFVAFTSSLHVIGQIDRPWLERSLAHCGLPIGAPWDLRRRVRQLAARNGQPQAPRRFALEG